MNPIRSLLFFFLWAGLFLYGTPVFAQNPTLSVSHAPVSPTTSDSVVITANASDADGIQSITIYLEQTAQKTCANVETCQFVYRTSIAGPYTYYAQATDTKGVSTATSFQTFTVSLAQQPASSSTSPSFPSSSTISAAPPTVSVSHRPSSPAAGDYISVLASASDADGIKTITMYMDGALKQTCSSITTCETSSAQYGAGPHSYYAKAEDYKSATTTSATQSFTVAGSSSSPVPSNQGQAKSADVSAQINELMKRIALLQAELQKQKTTRPIACGGVTFSRILVIGSSGADVKCLQVLLNRDSATKVAVSGAGAPGYESLYFGNRTKSALIKFQQKYLTAGNGIMDEGTRAKLNSTLSSFPH